MKLKTHTPGILRVGSALPDPPFEFLDDGKPTGFDVEWLQAIAAHLGLEWQLARYTGGDFNGIFAGLGEGSWDCVASGTTITPERQAVASFGAPYFESGQSLVVNIKKTPQVRTIDDLSEMIIGVQHGNTSEPVAQRLQAAGKVAAVRTYAYHDIGVMLADLEAGKLQGVMKLAPVMHWLIRQRPALRVVQEGITQEKLGVAVRLGNEPLRQAIDAAQARLREQGVLDKLIRRWLQT
jgi:polar amino acid transport system substrate-binding protein